MVLGFETLDFRYRELKLRELTVSSFATEIGIWMRVGAWRTCGAALLRTGLGGPPGSLFLSVVLGRNNRSNCPNIFDKIPNPTKSFSQGTCGPPGG